MSILLLVTLLHVLRIDTTFDATKLGNTQQFALTEQLLSSQARPIYHITKNLGPWRMSGFVQPAQPITARAGIVIDEMSGQVLWQKNSDVVLPIASLTKLTTALVFLDTQPDFSREIVMDKSDQTDPDGSLLTVKPGESLTVGDLFNSSLIGSANNATKAMVRSTGLSETDFVQRMNAKVQQLGLTQTTFHEVTGLDPSNTSTVVDYSRLASFAFRNSIIRETLNKKEYTFSTINTKKSHRIKNTDLLLSDAELHLVGAKTGYLDEAGYTFAAQSEVNGHTITVVLFKSETSQTRFNETKALIQWVGTVFTWL
jgi:serine-type D-Ala-D-Ala endopeptidase (penicillin-binding protein 7)